MRLLSRLLGSLRPGNGSAPGPAAASFIRDVPVIINCRDRVSSLRELVKWLEAAGHGNIILLDNASTYPPLVEYLATTRHRVERLGQNLGHTAVWNAEALSRTWQEQWFVYTDPDVVPDESCPADVVARLRELLEEHPGYVKAGPALRTDDLPDRYRQKAKVIELEAQFYAKALAPGVYDSFIDTTFALYRPGTPYSHGPALRCTQYRARHLPWYADSTTPSEEDIYYGEHADREVSNWSQLHPLN